MIPDGVVQSASTFGDTNSFSVEALPNVLYIQVGSCMFVAFYGGEKLNREAIEGIARSF
jgi:hypothetical protein